MSIMLIRPMTPQTSRSGIVSVQYPINVGYLSAYIKSHGIACVAKDFEVEPYDEESFLESVKQIAPSLIGFSCMTPHIPHAATVAGALKARFPNIITVVGGVHASAIPEETLREFPQFDVAVCGEGEQTLLELYQRLSRRESIAVVSGIVYRDQGREKKTRPRPMLEDIDRFPFPERDLVDLFYYRRSHVSRGFSRKMMNIAEIICSRGCPYSCIFCASKIAHTQRVRFRSPENIIAEMETLIGKYHVNHFSILDDTFTIKMELLQPVCEYMQSRKVTFDCFTRVNDIDPEKISVMMSGGCRKISFGIESGSPKVLNLIKKGITLEHVERAFQIARRAKLPLIEATFMLGSHPDETREDIEMTRQLIFKLKPDIMGLFITIPYPGTELNRILKERHLLTRERWEEFTLFFGNPSWQLGNIPRKELQRILKSTYCRYYFSPSYLLKRLVSIRSFKEFTYYWDGAVSLVASLAVKKTSGRCG